MGQLEKNPESNQTVLALELKLTKEQLEESRNREEWYKKQIDSLTDTMKLLEAPKYPQHPRRWYQFWK